MTEFPARAPSPTASDPVDVTPAERVRRLLVIHNPVAGWRRVERFRRTVQQLEHHGCAITERATTGPGDAETIASAAGEVDVVVVAGGDGTVNEVLNGLMQRPGDPLPLAVIPLGTANVLAGELGLPIEPEGVARAIAHGRTVTAHLGQARFDGQARRFALMAGAGFDAQAGEWETVTLPLSAFEPTFRGSRPPRPRRSGTPSSRWTGGCSRSRPAPTWAGTPRPTPRASRTWSAGSAGPSTSWSSTSAPA